MVEFFFSRILSAMDPTLRSISLQATDQMRTRTRQWRNSCRQYLATFIMFRLNDQCFTPTTVYNEMTTHHLHTDYCCTCAGKIKNGQQSTMKWPHIHTLPVTKWQGTVSQISGQVQTWKHFTQNDHIQNVLKVSGR